jgi:hypothetical protein
MVNDDD